MITDFDGMQKAGKESVEMAMKSFETGTAALEKVMASSSVEKAFEAQTEYLKSAYEGYLGEMSKLGTMMTDLTREASKPYEGLFGKFPK